MNRHFLEQLSCPYCGSALSLKEVTEALGDEIRHGCVECRCREFPVLEGILILRDYVLAPQVIRAIRQGRTQEAVGLLCTPHQEWAARVVRFLQSRGKVTGLFGELTSRVLKGKARRLYRRYSQEGVSFSALSGNDPFSLYFKHRYSAHSIWSAYPFVPILKQRKGPILDFGCGAGHLSYLISSLAEPDQLVGVDHEYRFVYMARKFFAPGAEFICLDANAPLPFRDRTFNTLISLDAVHCIKAHTVLAKEVERILTPQGLFVLLHLHNILQENFFPNWPLTPSNWLELFQGIPARAYPEKELIEDFLVRDRLDLSRSYGREELDGSPAIALVGSRDSSWYRMFEQAGTPFFNPRQLLQINPSYVLKRDSDGAYWAREFPSERFRQEYSLAGDYMPERVDLEGSLARRIKGRCLEPGSETLTREEEGLVEKRMRQFFLIPAPRDYC